MFKGSGLEAGKETPGMHLRNAVGAASMCVRMKSIRTVVQISLVCISMCTGCAFNKNLLQVPWWYLGMISPLSSEPHPARGIHFGFLVGDVGPGGFVSEALLPLAGAMLEGRDGCMPRKLCASSCFSPICKLGVRVGKGGAGRILEPV